MSLNTEPLRTLDDVRAFLEGTLAVSFAAPAGPAQRDWIAQTLLRVQPTIESALTVLRDRKPTGTEVYLFYGEGRDIYVAVLKPTTNPITGADELYLDSFRRSSRYELDRQRRRLEVVR